MKIINNERVFYHYPNVIVITNSYFLNSVGEELFSNQTGRMIQTLQDGYCLIRFDRFKTDEKEDHYIDRYIHESDFTVINWDFNNN